MRTAQWKYISFKVARPSLNETIEANSATEEVVIVPLVGRGKLLFNGQTHENGFAIQRIYTRDTDLDVAIPVKHGDVVLIHEGYHPVVKAPGTNAYYLNFLTGDVRKISAVNDPFYDWVSKNWEGNPIEIPLKS